jgi:cation diffusion facilitator family transporter
MIAGIIGHSQALIADGVESLADILSSIIVWRGAVVAAEPEDEDHPYGHGKAEPIAAAIVSVMLMFAAAGITVQAVFEIRAPGEGPALFTLPVLLVIVVIKEFLFRWVIREAASIESGLVTTDAWHHRSDAITSLAAALGISIALVGGPAYAIADPIAAMIAAVIIVWNGWRLLRPAIQELMDASPGSALNAEIPAIARSIPAVEEVEKCIIRKMGYLYFVDMHIEVNPQMTVQQGHDVAHQVKDTIRARIPAVRDVLVHVEPRKP